MNKAKTMNKRLRDSITKERMKRIKKELDITDVVIAEWFGFANANSYRNSTKRNEYDNGIIELYTLMKSKTQVKVIDAIDELKSELTDIVGQTRVKILKQVS